MGSGELESDLERGFVEDDSYDKVENDLKQRSPSVSVGELPRRIKTRRMSHS